MPDDVTIDDPAGRTEAFASAGEEEETIPSIGGIDLLVPTLGIGNGKAKISITEFSEAGCLVSDFSRYEGFQPLGQGGVGAVSSCVDPHLGREVALKMLHPKLRNNGEQRARFIREARVMAEIEHPNIVPVHELGVCRDEGVYFTMKRVRGISLHDILEHLAAGDPETMQRYTLRTLLDIFTHVCEAMAFAHSRQVIHRDLKPANIQVGEFGEVLVMDWGLAKILAADGSAVASPDSAAPTTILDDEGLGLDSGTVTIEGAVSGTPAYMAPEQAKGRISELDVRTDLYSLGAILYEILSLERMIPGHTVGDVLAEVKTGRIVSPRKRRVDRRVPRELDAICMRAVQYRREDRYQTVPALLQDLFNYEHNRPVSVCRDTLPRQGWKWCMRHRVASAAILVALLVVLLGAGGWGLVRGIRYRTLVATADQYRQRGGELFGRRVALLQELQMLQAERVAKVPGPREVALEERLKMMGEKVESDYSTATLLYVGASPYVKATGVRTGLNEILGNRLKYAALVENYGEVNRLLNSARQWMGPNFEEATPGTRARLLRLAELVREQGSVGLRTTPPGATALIWQLKPDVDGVLKPMNPVSLGQTPVARHRLDTGSYLITLQGVGRVPTRVPVLVEQGRPTDLAVAMLRQLPAGMVYVPAGPFLVGGPTARYYRLHAMELPGFFIKETEVTVADYLAYWLAADGAAGNPRDQSQIRLAREDRSFIPAWDAAGKLDARIKPGYPVVGITQAAARRYCEWLTRQRGRTVRLPSAEEWEKAARGVDGRIFPWGDAYSPNVALTVENTVGHEQFPLWAPPGSFPLDQSIYGAFDMGGNVREWTASRFADGGPLYQIKGGSASVSKRYLHCAQSSDTPVVPSDVGFRYLMPLAPGDLE